MLSTPTAGPLSGTFGTGPFAPFRIVWHHRRLIVRLARRELAARYRGSLLGTLWAVLNPLIMLGVYSFVFTVVFQARWGVAADGDTAFVLLLFSGLILFTVFAECVNRSPSLLLENVSYIKRVVFPLEILPVVVLAVALANAGIGLVLLLCFQLLVHGPPPWTAVLLPLAVLPLALVTLGLTWFLAATGLFLRDLRQVTGVAVTSLMFLSPIFYPLAAIPEHLRGLLALNPLTPILEQSKGLLFWGRPPPAGEWLVLLSLSWVVAWLGYAWFMKTRRGFADVV